MNNLLPEELEHIDEYLAGTLGSEELAAFEKRMQEDEQWRKTVEEIRLLTIGVQESAMQDIVEEYHRELIEKAPVVKMNWFRKVAAVAAVLLVLIAAGWWILLRPAQSEKLFAEYFKPDSGLPTTMGVSDNYTFDKAMVEYKMGEYKKAITSWRELEKQEPGSDTLQYFIAVALVADKSYEASLPYFDRVIAADKSAFLSESYWYKALALLQLDRKDEALSALRQSAHPQAAALIKKLE